MNWWIASLVCLCMFFVLRFLHAQESARQRTASGDRERSVFETLSTLFLLALAAPVIGCDMLLIMLSEGTFRSSLYFFVATGFPWFAWQIIAVLVVYRDIAKQRPSVNS